MTKTRANVEFLLVARVSPLLEAAGMAVTVAGSNAALNDPIAHAVRQLGYTVTSAVLVADADVAQVTVAQTDEFLGYATLYTLEAILGNLDDVDLRVGPRAEYFSQLAAQVERKIDRLRAILAAEYGYGVSSVDAGYIQINVAEHD